MRFPPDFSPSVFRLRGVCGNERSALKNASKRVCAKKDFAIFYKMAQIPFSIPEYDTK